LEDERQQDKLKSVELLNEVREAGKNVFEPIEITMLIFGEDKKIHKRKILVPLSEIADANHLTHLNPKHKILIPILIKYLHEFKTSNYKDTIASTLKVKGFYDATEPLIKEFNTTILGDGYKWSIGDAFSIILDKRFENQYIEIIKNKKHGHARQMVTIALGKLKSERAIPVLISLLDDEDVNGHVVMALGYYKKPELKKYIEPFLTYKKTWIRNAAKSALKKMERASLKK
jgi:hypothetical protein